MGLVPERLRGDTATFDVFGNGSDRRIACSVSERLPLLDDARDLRIGGQRCLLDGVVGSTTEIAANIIGALVEDKVQLR